MKYLKQFHIELDNGLSQSVFNHLRNYLMCSFLLAVGVAESQNGTAPVFGQVLEHDYTGMGLIGLSCILISLNLYDGIRKISTYKYHLIFTVMLIILYFVASIRVVELALHFRSGLFI